MEQIGFFESVKLSKKYKLNFSDFIVIKSLKDIKKIKRYPAVMKIFSKKIVHKSDVNGVVTDIKNEAEAEKAFASLKKIKNSEGIICQQQADGKQVILGIKRDSQFGPVIMFGLGGIFVEVLKDVSFRICPVDKKMALVMMREIKGYKILGGLRGEKGVNTEAIAEIITRLSNLAMKEKSIKEIDLNPVIVNEKTAAIVDVRMMK